MKKLLFLTIFSAIFAIPVPAQNAGLNIIPQPKSVTLRKGEFKLNYKTKIVATDDEGRRSAGILIDKIDDCLTNLLGEKGLDESSEPNAFGYYIESLIDKFYVG
jgi:hypothetical protein